MRRRARLLAATLLAVSMAWAGSTPALADDDRGSITGTLVPADGSDPARQGYVKLVPVAANGSTGAIGPAAVTNAGSTGAFRFDGVPAGRYKLVAVPGGAKNLGVQWHPEAPTASAAEVVVVAPGQHVALDPAARLVAGSLRVTVTTPDGRAAGGEIDLFDDDGRRVSSDDDMRPGSTMRGLQPGRYVLASRPATAASYVEYNANKRTIPTANRVTVTSGATRTLAMRLHYPSLRSTKKPKVVPETSAGRLASTYGSWTPAPKSAWYTYRWLREGTVVGGSGPHLRLTSKDVGKRFKVCVWASRPGYGKAKACSNYSAKVPPRSRW